MDVDASALPGAPNCARLEVRWVAERVIGELFGRELAHGLGTFEPSPAILPTLLPRYRRRELAPSPQVDACLGRLVAIARCEFDQPFEPKLRSTLRELDVREHIVQRLHADARLARRARSLRRIAAMAEAALEVHYHARILDGLRASLPHGSPAPAGPLRVQQLLTYFASFPYADNYVELVRAELRLLHADVSPLYVRDRQRLHLSARERAALQRARLSAAPRLSASLAAARAIPPQRRSFVVCGCGPLPLTGLLLHAFTGSRVTLVDCDPQSAWRAAELVAELERLGALASGFVRVLIADAAESDAWAGAHDAVLVASLVPNAAKLALARALAAGKGGTPKALLLRSAAGLCAELAYEAVPTEQISTASLPFCGESVPAHQVISGLPEQVAALRSVTTPASTELVTVADASVLNTTELYRAVAESIETGA